ncbi:MAG TPA: hypothetical protein VET90_09240 [Candidatus Binatus sp.]|nr:hypothetical protein [Candidatus Binatus sp.]
MTRVVVHLLNDQPVTADVAEAPKPGDVSLICSNVKTLDGRRPVFIDQSDSTFVFPYAGIRFVEIPTGKGPTREVEAEAEPDELEIDEDFLRRVREA